MCDTVRSLVCGVGVLGQILFADGDVAFACHAASAFAIESFIVGLQGVQAVDVAVVHAERRGDQHGVVNLQVRCDQFARRVYVGGRNQLAILLHFARNDEQRLEFGADGGLREGGLHLLDQRFSATQMGRGNGSVNAV